MNTVTKMAIKDFYHIDPSKAIAVTHNPIVCPHFTDRECISIYEFPSLSSDNDISVINLEQYKYGKLVTFIGSCPKCGKVYYLT